MWLVSGVLLVPGLLLSACGAAETVDAGELVQAADRTRAAGTSRIAITGEGKTSARGEGEIDHERRRARISFEATDEDGKAESGEIIVIGTQVFAHSEPPLTETSKPWVRFDRADEPPSLDELVFPFPFGDPADSLAFIEDSRGAVDPLGKAVVRGVDVQGYRVTIELVEAIKKAPEKHRAALREELAETELKTRPLEVWIDDEGLLRRLSMRQADETVTLDFYDFGTEVDIEEPPRSQVATLEETLGLPSLSSDPEQQPSARFVMSESSFGEETTGNFDWRTRTGRARTTAGGATTEIIQIGDDCYRRESQGEWRRSDVPAGAVDGACDDVVFANPATVDDLLEFVASAKSVGKETVRGVETTHYRGSLNIGAVKGGIEYWVDAEGNTRRTVQTTGKDETVQEWFDLGVAVQVERPAVKGKG